MSLHDRIREARSIKGMTQEELGKFVGAAKTTVSGWEKNREPTIAQIGAIADVLDSSVDFLLQDEISAQAKKKRPAEIELPEEEKRMVKLLRGVPENQKEFAVDLVESVLQVVIRHAPIPEEPQASVELAPVLRLPLRLSLQPVSAGRGAYLGPEEFETVFVEDNSLTERASFAVRVSGDSMEPTYSDGDILLIQGAEDIQIGEIGVFTMGGDGYVKKRGDGELISLNPEYAAIRMDNSIWCNGRVIGKLAPEWIL